MRKIQKDRREKKKIQMVPEIVLSPTVKSEKLFHTFENRNMKIEH